MTKHSQLWKKSKQTFPALKSDLTVDVLIIGGGMSGVSAAYWLSQSKLRNQKIALIERDLISNATGAGTGILSPGMDMDFVDLIRKFGLAFSKKLYAEHKKTLREIKSIIKKHGLRCDFDQSGNLTLAMTARESKLLEKELIARKKVGEKSSLLANKELHRYLESSAFSGLYNPGDAILNQEKFIAQLAGKCANVKMYENTPALKITDGNNIVVKTPNGNITARKVILTAGTGTTKIFNYNHKISKYTCFVISTKPLTQTQLKSINWSKGHALWPLGNVYDFVRLTKDNRLIVAGEDTKLKLNKKRQELKFKHLQTFLNKVFPQLKNFYIDNEWSGEVIYGENQLPQLGKQKNIYYAFAYSGNGLLTAFASGKKLAKQITK